jgi:diacylglycerol O-acyltransferase 1
MKRTFVHVKHFNRYREAPWQDYPFVSALLLNTVFLTLAFAIEWMLSQKKFSESYGMLLHHINAHASLIIPMLIVWNLIDHPAIGAVVLFHATITWMKLISYILANEDYRLASREDGGTNGAVSLSLVENLDADESDLTYPQNVTMRNMFYYWVAPTLTYQIAFPRYPQVRYWRVAGIALRMMTTFAVFSFLVAQVVTPALEGLVRDLEETNGRYTFGILAEYW